MQYNALVVGTRSWAQVPVRGLSFRGVRASPVASSIPFTGAPTSLGPPHDLDLTQPRFLSVVSGRRRCDVSEIRDRNQVPRQGKGSLSEGAKDGARGTVYAA